MFSLKPSVAFRGLWVFVAGSLSVACGAGAQPMFDTPSSPNAPRATLVATIDLRPDGDCDERFDLALYEDRSIERISWDSGTGCTGRRVEIRYLSASLTQGALVQRMKDLALQVKPQ